MIPGGRAPEYIRLNEKIIKIVQNFAKIVGGKWVNIALDKAHTDGNLVTASAWPAHPEWLAKFLEVLRTKIEP